MTCRIRPGRPGCGHHTHISEQTVDDEPDLPFGSVLDSGTGVSFGGTANLDAFTETRWVTIRGDIAPYPF